MTNPKILVVEDERIQAMDIKRMLEHWGYEVPTIVSSGEEAIKKALKLKPDLVLMDIVLKGKVDGIEAAEKIKDRLDIPVIYLTAHPEESMVQRAKMTEPYGYILKPFDERELRVAIDTALYKHEMEQRLKESEEKFKLLYKEAPLPYQSLNEDGYFIEVNQALLDTLGYSREEVIGRWFGDFLTPRYVDHFKKNFARFKAAGEIRGIEFEMVKKDGSHINVSFDGKIGYDKHGMFKQTHCIFYDITKRKKREKKLHKYQQLLEKTFASLLSAVFIIDADTVKIIDCNPAASEIFGYSQKEMLGKTTTFLHVNKKTLKEFREYLYPAVEKKGFLYLPEFKMRRKDGTVFPTEHSVMPLRDKQGKITNWVSVVNDITERKQAEMALRESEAKYRYLFEESKQPIYITSKEGRFIDFNPSMLDLFGYTPEEMRELDVRAIYADPSDRERFQEVIEKEGYVKDYEVKLRKKNGTEIDCLLTSSVRLADDGNVLGYQGIIQDITERKKAEKALKESEKKLKEIINGSPIPQFVINKDHKVIYWNEALEKCTGIRAEEIIGTNQHWRAFYSEERPCMADLLVDGDIEGISKWYSGKCDRSKFVEDAYEATDFFPLLGEKGKWLYFTAKAIKDSAGNIVGALETLEDITERKLAEEDLKESEEKYRILVESANEAILVAQDGMIKFANPKVMDILGYSKKEVTSKPFVEFLHPDDQKMVFERYSKRLKGEKVSPPYTFRVINKKGDIRWLEINAVVITWEDRPATLNFLTDITDRKKAEDQIKRSLKEKELLLREIHHRVKNNLQIISSLLSLQSRYIKDKEAFELFKESQARVKSIAGVHEKLYQSKDLTRVNFADYIKSLSSNLLYSYAADPNLIKLNVNVDDVMLDINTAIPLGLIVNELLTNSIKHAFPDGRSGEINVDFRSVDDKFILVLSDDGVGFPEGLDFRATETLGLQLVTILTEQIDGTIELDRSHGTEFKIVFRESEYGERI